MPAERQPIRSDPPAALDYAEGSPRDDTASPGESDGSTAVSGPLTLVKKFLPGGRTVHVQVDDGYSDAEEDLEAEEREEDQEDFAQSEYEDAGAIIDRSDKGYHGRAGNNRVQRSIQPSIIQTRSARAQASSTPPNEDGSAGDGDHSLKASRHESVAAKRQSAPKRSGPARAGGSSSSTTTFTVTHAQHQTPQRATSSGSHPKPVPKKLMKPANPKVYVVNTDSDGADQKLDENLDCEDNDGLSDERDITGIEASLPRHKDSKLSTGHGVRGSSGYSRVPVSNTSVPSSSSRGQTTRAAPQSPRLPSSKKRRIEEEAPVEDYVLSEELSDYERSQRWKARKAQSSSTRQHMPQLSSEPEIVNFEEEEPVIVEKADHDAKSDHEMDVEDTQSIPRRLSRSAVQGRSNPLTISPSIGTAGDEYVNEEDVHLPGFADQVPIPHIDLKGKRRASVPASNRRSSDHRDVKPARQAATSSTGASRSSRPSVNAKPAEPSKPDVFMAPVPLTLVPKNESKSSDSRKGSSDTPKQRRTFGVLFGVKKTTKSESSGGSSASQASAAAEKTLDDLMYHTVVFIPDTCQVTNIQLQDDMLQPYYIGLPPLSSGSFAPWRDYDMEGGMLLFSTWGETCPDLDVDSCLNALNFTTHRNYINLCRASLQDVLIKNIPGATSTYHLYTQNRQYAMCLSSVMCTSSNLVEPHTKGLHLYQIRGMFHSQEWERFVGFICSAFGHEILDSQLFMHSISFSTRAPEKEKDFGSGSNTPSTPARPSGSKYTNVRSPSVGTALKPSTTAGSWNFSLPFGAPIPVYDCRSVDLNLERDLDRLDELPRWSKEAEIPVGSFVVVAHTVGVYKAQKTGHWTVALNIQWVMVLGVPANYRS